MNAMFNIHTKPCFLDSHDKIHLFYIFYILDSCLLPLSPYSHRIFSLSVTGVLHDCDWQWVVQYECEIAGTSLFYSFGTGIASLSRNFFASLFPGLGYIYTTWENNIHHSFTVCLMLVPYYERQYLGAYSKCTIA